MRIPEWYGGESGNRVLVGVKHPGNHNQKVHGRRGRGGSDINKYFTGDVEVSFKAFPNAVSGARATTEKEIFGRELKDHEYAELVGAPDGLHIQVRHSPASTMRPYMLSPANIEIRAMGGKDLGGGVQPFHPMVNVMERKIYGPRSGESGSTIYNNKLYLKRDAPKGMGTRILAGEVSKARKLGITKIETAGVRSGTENGYYTWPRLGYEVRKEDRRALKMTLGRSDPNGVFSGVSTFADLFSRPQGREFWKMNGTSVMLEFDLSSKSSSSKVLSRYLKAKGISVGS